MVMKADPNVQPNPPIGFVPVPDPTTLTNELVSKAIAALREIIETRLEGNDKAVALLSQWREHLPQEIDKAVGHLRQIHDERFDAVKDLIAVFKEAVNDRFTLNSEQTDKAARDVKSAVDAAFAAAKEAVGEQNKSNALSITKSEAATAEAIRQGQTLFQSAISALTTQMNDLKSRLDKGEGSRVISDPALASSLAAMNVTLANLQSRSDNASGAKQASGDFTGWIFGAVGVAAAVALVIVDFVALHK